MASLRYALVAYIKNPIGEFVENLRRELHPDLPHFASHLTLLPPRLLLTSESSALQVLINVCDRFDPFEVVLGDIESFCPTTPTVYIRVAQGASRVRELHDLLNTDDLKFSEEWPYTPHITIAKLNSEEAAQQALEVARRHWRQFTGSRTIRVDRLTFVREDALNCWVDLAPLMLGASLVSP